MRFPSLFNRISTLLIGSLPSETVNPSIETSSNPSGSIPSVIVNPSAATSSNLLSDGEPSSNPSGSIPSVMINPSTSKKSRGPTTIITPLLSPYLEWDFGSALLIIPPFSSSISGQVSATDKVTPIPSKL